MKISFRRMVLEPPISPHDVQLDRPLFEEINLSIHTYMKRIDRPYTINEAYMFYDFFVPCIIILRICFRLSFSKTTTN